MTTPRCPDCGMFHVSGPLARPCHLPRLRDAFRGVALTEQDERLLRWLAGSDQVEALLWLVDRLRAHCVLPQAPRK
jgi:hypothetical protein